jgi:hypothetical protein
MNQDTLNGFRMAIELLKCATPGPLSYEANKLLSPDNERIRPTHSDAIRNAMVARLEHHQAALENQQAAVAIKEIVDIIEKKALDWKASAMLCVDADNERHRLKTSEVLTELAETIRKKL